MEYGKPADDRANRSNRNDVRICRPTQKPHGSRRSGDKQNSVNVAPTHRTSVVVVVTRVVGGCLVAANAEKLFSVGLIHMGSIHGGITSCESGRIAALLQIGSHYINQFFGSFHL